jgi:hypothetical protein
LEALTALELLRAQVARDQQVGGRACTPAWPHTAHRALSTFIVWLWMGVALVGEGNAPLPGLVVGACVGKEGSVLR